MRNLILAGALTLVSFPALADLVIITETAPPRPQFQRQGYSGFVERRVAPPEEFRPEGCERALVSKDADRSAWGPDQGRCG